MWVEPFSLSLATPLGTAAGKITDRRGLLIGLTVEGHQGLGEATPLAGWTESYETCRRTLQSVVQADEMPPNRPDPTETPAAAHSVDLAVCDGRARLANRSLAEWLHEQFVGSRTPAESVPVNATIGDGDVETTVAAATAAVEEGFEWLKLKVGARSVSADLDRIRAVDRAVGERARIRLDANGAWSRTEADRLLSELAVDIEYLEQPLAADDLEGLAALRGHGVDIAVDESLSINSLATILDAEAADVAVLKPMALGGPTRTIETAMQAQSAGLTPTVTTTVDAVVARTAAVHVAAALPEVSACGLATGSLLSEDLAADPIEISDGHAWLPTGSKRCEQRFDGLWPTE